MCVGGNRPAAAYDDVAHLTEEDWLDYVCGCNPRGILNVIRVEGGGGVSFE